MDLSNSSILVMVNPNGMHLEQTILLPVSSASSSYQTLLSTANLDIYVVNDTEKPVPEFDPKNPVNLQGFQF